MTLFETDATAPPRRHVVRRAVVEVLVVLLAFAAAGAGVGWLWHALWDSPPGVAYEGTWVANPYDPGNRTFFGATAVFVLLGAGASLVLGTLAALLTKASELATLAAVALGSVGAAALAYRLGSGLGPPDAAAAAKGAADFTPIPGSLSIEGLTPFAAWPLAGLAALGLLYLLTYGAAETRRHDADDPAWMSPPR